MQHILTFISVFFAVVFANIATVLLVAAFINWWLHIPIK